MRRRLPLLALLKADLDGGHRRTRLPVVYLLRNFSAALDLASLQGQGTFEGTGTTGTYALQITFAPQPAGGAGAHTLGSITIAPCVAGATSRQPTSLPQLMEILLPASGDFPFGDVLVVRG
jgi:hypothetical protein